MLPRPHAGGRAATQHLFEAADPELPLLRLDASHFDALAVDEQRERRSGRDAVLLPQRRAVGRHDPHTAARGDRNGQEARFEELRGASLVTRHRKPEHREPRFAGRRCGASIEHLPRHPVDLGFQAPGGDSTHAATATATAGRRGRGVRQKSREQREEGERSAHGLAPVGSSRDFRLAGQGIRELGIDAELAHGQRGDMA